MAETYGGDVDAITWVMQEMVNDVDVKVHDISNQTKRRDVVKKVNQVCTCTASITYEYNVHVLVHGCSRDVLRANIFHANTGGGTSVLWM